LRMIDTGRVTFHQKRIQNAVFKVESSSRVTYQHHGECPILGDSTLVHWVVLLLMECDCDIGGILARVSPAAPVDTGSNVLAPRYRTSRSPACTWVPDWLLPRYALSQCIQPTISWLPSPAWTRALSAPQSSRLSSIFRVTAVARQGSNKPVVFEYQSCLHLYKLQRCANPISLEPSDTTTSRASPL